MFYSAQVCGRHRYETALYFPLLPPLISPLTPKLYYSIASLHLSHHLNPQQIPKPLIRSFVWTMTLPAQTPAPLLRLATDFFILRSILSLYLSISPLLLSVTFDLNLCFYQPRWLWAYSQIAHPYVCTHINAHTNMLQTLSLSSQPPFMITPSHFQTLSVSHSLLIFLPVALQAPQMAFSDRYNKKINRILLLLLVFCMTKFCRCSAAHFWSCEVVPCPQAFSFC